MGTERITRVSKEDAGRVKSAGRDVRYVPEKGQLDFFAVAHETRYLWVGDNLPLTDKAVLDFGCGSGYGASLLAEKADRVYGIDACTEAIAFARQSYPKPNLQYAAVDACSLPDLCKVLAPHTCDLLVSFDVIEHVERYFDYLANASRLLKKDGQFLLSTPNRLETFAWNSKWNPYHFQEFSPYQLRKILGLYFERVALMAQDFRDDARREAVRESMAARKAMKELDPVTRAVRKSWQKVVRKMRGGAHQRVQALDYSDIVFSLEPGEQALGRAFGLLAICTQPRDGNIP